jgi:hypothetical protein
LRDMACHPVREPLMETERTSPAPATFVGVAVDGEPDAALLHAQDPAN